MKKTFMPWLAAALAALPGASHAYDEFITHPVLSNAAVRQSALATDPDLLPRLGRKPFFWDQRFEVLPITSIVAIGATGEDIGDRSINHFYDPVNDLPLNFLGISSIPFVGTAFKSPDWALEDLGTFQDQLDSFRDARESYYNALTLNDPASSAASNAFQRNARWTRTFEQLGHVIHHVQDMAQPQHVRNDVHCDRGFFKCGIVAWAPSRYEKYTKTEADQRVRDLAANGPGNAAMFPGAAEFRTPRDFWKNGEGTGIAQFVNKQFVSQGSNFKIGFFSGQLAAGTYQDPKPGTPVDYVIDDLFAAQRLPTPTGIRALCADVAIACKMAMIPSLITAKASTLSIYDQDLEPRGLTPIYHDGFGPVDYAISVLTALNRFNFDAVHDPLIPTAVSYSAGLLNYFFRGNLEVTLPAEGVYGVVDHSTIHQTDPVAGFAGFDTIKLRVRNASPGGEPMTAGSLVAVARFHRNGCYKDDLTGEFDDTFVPKCADFRTDPDEVVVSNVFQNVALDAVASTPFTFTFTPPIPINATDLHIQLVYRGKLGDEGDAVVVGDKDVFEPTYLAIFNSTDQILVDGVFKATTDPTLLPRLDQDHDGVIDARFDQTTMDIFFGFLDSFNTTPLASVLQLPPARYSRVALITDRNPYPSPIEGIGTGFFSAAIQQYSPETNQLDFNANAYFVAAFTKLRGVVSWDSLTYYRFVGSTSVGDLATLPPLANTAPVPLTVLTFKP